MPTWVNQVRKWRRLARHVEARFRADRRSGYDRLAQAKAIYDPANIFHVNQNIQPSAEATAEQPSATAEAIRRM